MDGDGTCDALDIDIDGDGTNNTEDAFPEDLCATIDTDGDGLPDTIVADCATDLTEDDDDDLAALTWTIYLMDSYGDGSQQGQVTDASGANVLCVLTVYSSSDSCTVTSAGISVYVEEDYSSYYYGESSLAVTDPSGVTTYLDNGGTSDWYYGTIAYSASFVAYNDTVELLCGSDPADSTDNPLDLDGDGLCDEILDDDNDGDGYSNADELVNCGGSDDSTLSTDANDSTSTPLDTDGDLVCDVLDSDDDDDGVADDADVFPLDGTEWLDTDGDLIGNNADTDDDGDGIDDVNSTGVVLDECPLGRFRLDRLRRGWRLRRERYG